MNRRVMLHEAAHCASYLTDGVRLRFARVDGPAAGIAGLVRPDWPSPDLDSLSLRKDLIATLMGPVAHGCVPIGWPIDFGRWGKACSGDIAHAARAALELDFDLVDWHGALAKAQRRFEDNEFRSLMHAIATAFERTPVLTGSQLDRIYGEHVIASALGRS